MSDQLRAAAQQALDSDHPDIQLRAAITLRAALAQPEPTRSQQMRDAGYTRRLRQLPEEDEQKQPERKPLTDEEIVKICMDCWRVTPSDIYFARAIERAHGIGGEA